jgi:putative oxidoreductase
MRLLLSLQRLLDATRVFDFLGPLALRLYLAPIFILAGSNKLANVENVTFWFESLGLPAPQLMVYLAGLTELIGGICLVAGLAVRWFAIPLMVTMAVAATTAHWENGWHVLPESELSVPWEWRTDMIEGAALRKEKAVELLEAHGNIDWLTEHGNITILKNGIEFAATYFIMLLVLFFIGAGRFFSLDYWLARAVQR